MFFKISSGDQMTHAKSLRVIGQTLEIARVTTFKLKRDGVDYLVQSDFTETDKWILRNTIDEVGFTEQHDRRSALNRPNRQLCFTSLNISRLDSQRQKQRQNHSSSQTQGSSKLSQLLRSLGDHLDRIRVGAFHISWTTNLVSVDYEEADGHNDCRTFSSEKLQALGLHMRFRRSSHNALTPVDRRDGRFVSR
jgi:hypothetical protein